MRNQGWRVRNRGWRVRVEGAGSGDRGGGEPGKIGAGNCFFIIENSKKMAVLCLQVILGSTKKNMHICVDYFVTRPT